MTKTRQTQYFLPCEGPRVAPTAAPRVAVGEGTVTLRYGAEYRAVLTYATGEVAWYRRATQEEWRAWSEAHQNDPAPEHPVSREWLQEVARNTLAEAERPALPPAVAAELRGAAERVRAMAEGM